MNIHAKKGHKIVVTEVGLKSGYNSDIELANKHLFLNVPYTVNYTDVHDWHTRVYLNEIPYIAFNSVHFDDYES